MQHDTLTDIERSVDLGWITIGYDDVGAGEVPIILLHGGGPGATSRSNFIANIPSFAAEHRVLAVDLPGFGRSDSFVMTNESRLTVSARAVVELMDKLGIEKANVVGNSLGGAIALAMAIDFPGRVNRIVVMGAGAGGGNPSLFGHTPTEGIKALQAAYRDRSLPTFRAFFDIMLYDSSSVSNDVLQERIEGVQQSHVDAWIESYKSPERSLVPQIADITAPVLILHGRNDRITSLESGLALLGPLQNSQLHVFNHCGHWVQYEYAEQFNKMVLDFFA